MSRLADYFIVVGYDHEKDRGGVSQGRVIQRFPEKDWDDCPFTQGIELFCQPAGWRLATVKQNPSFFVSVLTDIDADRHYGACLTFSEDVVVGPGKLDDEYTEEQDSVLVRSSKMYAPRSLVLVSRVDCFETFRNCLGLLYTVYIEHMNVELETLIGNILGCIQVPPSGGPQIRFSIGAGDRQALQPPLSATLPITHSAVAMLFKQLGISDTLSVFCAALTDHKILFHSQSYTHLTDASHALTALMYPLKYSYVYIPLLPSGLYEVLNTPTPFIAGVHSSLKPEFSDLLDVIIVDLDGGSMHVPENVHLPVMPEPMYSRMVNSLILILRPDLVMADYAFPPAPEKSTPLQMLDKEIRAIFVQFFAELFFGYRSCLTIIRIHPEPFITFHKAQFLGHRGMVEDDFTTRVLDSMSFSTFVAERGPPYRVCDIFDEVFASMQDVLKTEEDCPDRLLHNIKDLAGQLYANENPNPQPYVQKVQKPTEGAHCRIHQPPFPHIDKHVVEEIMQEGMAKHSMKSKLSQIRPQQARIVPIGPHIESGLDRDAIISTHARRLEVLRNCVSFIFDNKISDAKKIFPAVLRALKSKIARQALVDELGINVQSNRAMLEHQQFDLLVRLLNGALQNDSSMDENGIAAAMLPLVCSFCRKLCTGVIQFAYTCVQEHAVWSNQQFWEATFYQDVQRQIRQLYLPGYEEHLLPEPDILLSPGSLRASRELGTSWSRESWRDSWRSTPDSKRRSVAHFRPKEISALEIAAEQLRVWPSLSKSQHADMVSNEESTVYSQAIHYANRMVYMRVPLDARRTLKEHIISMEGESTSSNITNSIAESDSLDADSAYDEQEVTEVGATVVKFVTRFVDKVCTESNVMPDHIRSLHQMIPGVVAMHIETLESVYEESKRLPPIQKPKILTPTLLPGEEIVMEGLRVYLIPDGREEGTGVNMGGPSLIPAEGAVFLTTYRIIFKGTPIDPLACEQVVCRSFPVSTLTREKKINVQYLQHLDQWLQEGLQLRSSTFQLLKMAFDEEVSTEDIETLRKLLNKVRSPPSVINTFAFSGHILAQTSQLVKGKEKNASLKGFAKRTLMKTARKAGLKPKEPPRKQKYIMPTPPLARRTLSGDIYRDRPASIAYEDELSVIDEQEIAIAIQTDAKNIDRLAERSYCRDYNRMNLGSISGNTMKTKVEPFRLSLVNITYCICRSYPAVLVVPQSVTDDSIRKFARSHRQYRFPVVTWKHPKTRAVLLRASGFHGKGVMGMLKGHQSSTSTGVGETTTSTSTSVEQEKYFTAVVNASPMAKTTLIKRPGLGSRSLGRSPTLRRFGSFRSALRASAHEQSPLGRIGSLRDRPRYSTSSLQYSMAAMSPKQNGTIDVASLSSDGFNRAVLYVLGEKTQMKGIKIESFPKSDFIPVDYSEVRHVKSSFKKLMRACVPSAPYTDPEKGFLKAVEDSEWLPQLHNVMLIAGAVVDLMDVQGSSVMLCLEDGWDFTTQVLCVAQILMDPYYRTMEGFKILIEKEWCAFGHRFTHRSNQTAANQASGFAPIFLQFLDIVHQIHFQFPQSFEFNQYLLKFLAYHYISNRFRTFMLDNEFERVEAGWLFDESQKKNKDYTTESDVLFTRPSSCGMSIWDYIERYDKKSPVFYNFLYSPEEHEGVLRPYSNISNLRIWDYFIMEDLAHGPSYEFEVVAKEKKMNEDQELVDGPIFPSLRKLVNGCYDNITQMLPDSCTYLLEEINRLETDLNHRTSPWKNVWDRLELPPREQLRRQVSVSTQLVRSHGRSIHKRSTIELLVKGKMLGDAAKIFSQHHHFEKFTYSTPAYCDYCSHVLWGLVKTGMRCTECGYNCHEKCLSHVPKNCTKLQPMSEVNNSSMTAAKSAPSDTASVTGVLDVGTLKGKSRIYQRFASHVSEHRTHEGYLYKRGALLKGWKQRWFVLDSMKHQLRYYDSPEDASCKGFIDLAEVVSVIPLKMRNVQGAPKKADENAFFEMKTVKRVYNFLAQDSECSQEWSDKIQSCIQ